jgi:hypothetical protein
MLYLENSMSRPGTPRPGLRNENNENNDRPPFYISPVSPDNTPRTSPPTRATPRAPPSTPATPLGQEYDYIKNVANSRNIKIPEKYYLIKGKHLLTKVQQDILDKMIYTTITDLDKYPFITEGYYYPYKSKSNDVAGFLFNTVKKLENDRQKINGQQGIIKPYFTKRSIIPPNEFHTRIPTATLENVDKHPRFQSGVIYDPDYPDEPYEDFDEFVYIETDRIAKLLEMKLASQAKPATEGGRRQKYYKKTICKTKRGKRKTRRA